MDATIVGASLIAAPLIIGALVAGWVTIYKTLKETKAQVTAMKDVSVNTQATVETTKTKVEEVYHLSNSRLTEATNEIKATKNEVAALREQIATLRAEKATALQTTTETLRQAMATTPPAALPAAPVTGPEPGEK